MSSPAFARPDSASSAGGRRTGPRPELFVVVAVLGLGVFLAGWLGGRAAEHHAAATATPPTPWIDWHRPGASIRPSSVAGNVTSPFTAGPAPFGAAWVAEAAFRGGRCMDDRAYGGHHTARRCLTAPALGYAPEQVVSLRALLHDSPAPSSDGQDRRVALQLGQQGLEVFVAGRRGTAYGIEVQPTNRAGSGGWANVCVGRCEDDLDAKAFDAFWNQGLIEPSPRVVEIR